MKEACKRGHPTPTRAHRDVSGMCLACKSALNKRRWAEGREQRQQLKQLAQLVEQSANQ